jgi:hypothetical protein
LASVAGIAFDSDEETSWTHAARVVLDGTNLRLAGARQDFHTIQKLLKIH